MKFDFLVYSDIQEIEFNWDSIYWDSNFRSFSSIWFFCWRDEMKTNWNIQHFLITDQTKNSNVFSSNKNFEYMIRKNGINKKKTKILYWRQFQYDWHLDVLLFWNKFEERKQRYRKANKNRIKSLFSCIITVVWVEYRHAVPYRDID